MDYESVNGLVGEQTDNYETEEPLNAADLYTPNTEEANAPVREQMDASVQEKGAERTFTQDELNRQIAKRLKEERKKAAYQLGTELLSERMSGGITEADALAAIRDERIKSKVAQFQADPAKGFEELMRERYSQQQSGRDDSPEAKTAALTQELMEERADGRIPSDFDLNGYMKDAEQARRFLSIREKLGVEEAVRIAKLEMRQATGVVNKPLPKPISTNNAYQPRTIDYNAMSSQDFLKLREEVRKKANSGRNVKI